jgi:hypothetical protein
MSSLIPPLAQRGAPFGARLADINGFRLQLGFRSTAPRPGQPRHLRHLFPHPLRQLLPLQLTPPLPPPLLRQLQHGLLRHQHNRWHNRRLPQQSR